MNSMEYRISVHEVPHRGWCAAPAGAGGAGGAPDQAPAQQLSSHERRVARMAERARALEAQNMGDKQWFLRGEANAGAPQTLVPAQYPIHHLVPRSRLCLPLLSWQTLQPCTIRLLQCNPVVVPVSVERVVGVGANGQSLVWRPQQAARRRSTCSAALELSGSTGAQSVMGCRMVRA